MSRSLPERYLEAIHRLALGVELVDRVRGRRVHRAVTTTVERPIGVTLMRHASALLTLTYGRGVSSPVRLLVADPTRRLVARRLELPFASEDDVLDGEAGDDEIPLAARVRRIALLPGAAYDLPERTTALRGRVLSGGEPVRWARVEARPEAGTEVLWRAHGDDRGEFLLVIGTGGANFGELVSPLAIEVTVIAPDPPPAPPADPESDPWADVPVELAPTPDLPDDVSSGEARPDAYDPGLAETRIVPLPLGRVTSDLDPYLPA